MLSKANFATAVRFFMREMSSVCLLETPESLRHLLGFREEILAFREVLRDPHSTDVAVLSGAFGVVDEYVHRKWDAIVNEIYDAYSEEESAKQRSQGR